MSIEISMSKAEFLFLREAVNQKFNSWMEEMNDAEEESNRPIQSHMFTLSSERVQALKEAGFWDDPEKRDQMIRKFAQSDREQVKESINVDFDKEYEKYKAKSEPVEKLKKPHWTQTAKGKKIMAARKKTKK
jgi:hypothetical protein